MTNPLEDIIGYYKKLRAKPGIPESRSHAEFFFGDALLSVDESSLDKQVRDDLLSFFKAGVLTDLEIQLLADITKQLTRPSIFSVKEYLKHNTESVYIDPAAALKNYRDLVFKTALARFDLPITKFIDDVGAEVLGEFIVNKDAHMTVTFNSGVPYHYSRFLMSSVYCKKFISSALKNSKRAVKIFDLTEPVSRTVVYVFQLCITETLRLGRPVYPSTFILD